MNTRGLVSLALAVVALALPVAGVSQAAALDTNQILIALTNPPLAQVDIFSNMYDQLDNEPAGLCVSGAQVSDPAAQHGTGAQLLFLLGRSSPTRQALLAAAAIQSRALGLHLAIWLYQWNGQSWAYTGRYKIRYPVSYSPFWLRPVGDPTPANVPNFTVASGTGYYRIRVGLLNSAGTAVNTAYVRGFGNIPNLDSTTPYCRS
jgi:hypothetical protein